MVMFCLLHIWTRLLLPRVLRLLQRLKNSGNKSSLLGLHSRLKKGLFLHFTTSVSMFIILWMKISFIYTRLASPRYKNAPPFPRQQFRTWDVPTCACPLWPGGSGAVGHALRLTPCRCLPHSFRLGH